MSTEGTDARAALIEAGFVGMWSHIENVDPEVSDEELVRIGSGYALDAMLAHPDALIALLVERGVLVQMGRELTGLPTMYRRCRPTIIEGTTDV